MASRRDLILGICVICLLTACTIRHEYQHKIYALDIDKIPSLNTANITKPVVLINVQNLTSEQLLGEVKMHKYYGSLSELTDAVITSAEAELSKRNIPVANDAQKKLNVSVTSAKLVRGAWVIRSILDLKVITGSGLEKIYHVENATPASVARAYDGAAALAVVEIFSDEDIISYLKNE